MNRTAVAKIISEELNDPTISWAAIDAAAARIVPDTNSVIEAAGHSVISCAEPSVVFLEHGPTFVMQERGGKLYIRAVAGSIVVEPNTSDEIAVSVR